MVKTLKPVVVKVFLDKIILQKRKLQHIGEYGFYSNIQRKP